MRGPSSSQQGPDRSDTSRLSPRGVTGSAAVVTRPRQFGRAALTPALAGGEVQRGHDRRDEDAKPEQGAGVDQARAHHQSPGPAGGQHEAQDACEQQAAGEDEAAGAHGPEEHHGHAADQPDGDDPPHAQAWRDPGQALHPAAACRSAASPTVVSRHARVIGPTPPGLGVSQPATSATPGSTSPATFDLPSGPGTRLTPTSSTAAPGLTMSAVTMPGTPAAATTMSARRTWAARSRVPVWHRVTVAFSLRRVSISPSGRPTVSPRPMTHTSAPAIGTS